MLRMKNDEYFMRRAIMQAEAAKRRDEVPVGAVVVREGEIIAREFNTRESSGNPTAHAELLAMTRAAKKLGGWRLIGCTLYVTLEPCAMCAGAIVNSRVERVVFGTRDPKAGGMGSVYNITEGKLNHKPEVTEGVLKEECSALLKSYFAEKREKKKIERRKAKQS